MDTFLEVLNLSMKLESIFDVYRIKTEDVIFSLNFKTIV